jgi:hypothetical protein
MKGIQITKSKELKEKIELLKKISDLERRVTALEARLSENRLDEVCDHCGSSNLSRTGIRPNPAFKSLGIKNAIFLCNDCGKESAFILDLTKSFSLE